MFITGDLFNGSCSAFHRFKDGLDGLRSRRGVFFVTGNHEGYAGLVAPLEFLKQTEIRVRVAPTPYSRDARESYAEGWRTQGL